MVAEQRVILLLKFWISNWSHIYTMPHTVVLFLYLFLYFQSSQLLYRNTVNLFCRNLCWRD